jgi:hypothetical protein
LVTLYYDVSEATWYNEPTALNESYRSDFVIYYGDCDWRNSDEFWCHAGRENYYGSGNSTVFKYSVSSGETSLVTHSFPVLASEVDCDFVGDIFYCYAMDDWDNEPLNEIAWYGASDDTSGTFSGLLTEASSAAACGIDESTYTAYCFGGYDPTFSQSYAAYSIQFAEPVVAPVVQESSSSGSRTRYAVDAGGNVVGVYQGSTLIQSIPVAEEKGTFLSLGGGESFDIKAWATGLWTTIKGWFVQ